MATVVPNSGNPPSIPSTAPPQDPVPLGEPTSNLPFDIRIQRRILTKDQIQVTSGRITTDTPSIQPHITPVSCYFLFNPAEIDSTYGFDTSQFATLPPQLQNSDPQSIGTQKSFALNQEKSFNLLFDRTYEVWTGSNSAIPQDGFGGPYRYGVMWDVWALERILGIYGQYAGQQPPNGPLTSIVSVELGGTIIPNTGGNILGTSPTPTGAGLNFLQFFGWFTGFSVQYTRFDANMTPTRCAIALTFQQTYANQTPTPSTANAATTTPSGLISSAAPDTPAFNPVTGVGGANTGV